MTVCGLLATLRQRVAAPAGTSRPGLADYQPTAVALFLADLVPEVRAAFPEVEAAGGHWVDVEGLGAWPTTASQQEQG
jgi:hypothetical protein